MMKQIIHGTLYGARYCKPRCQKCKQFESRYRKELREKRHRELSSDDPRHGVTRLYYTANCRCDKCVAAERARYAAHRKAKRASRKQALHQ